MKWVLCLLFNENFKKVLLIKKNRGPDFMVGKWNGLGGKIEKNETPFEAAQRELMEEAGLHVDNLVDVANLKTEIGDVHILSAWGDMLKNAKQMEDEQIKLHKTKDILLNYTPDYVSNLVYVIPMCLNRILGRDRQMVFEIHEF